MSANQNLRERRRDRLRYQLRQKAGGRPRLSVFRSGKNIYAQVIDDEAGKTLASVTLPGTPSKGAEDVFALTVGTPAS